MCGFAGEYRLDAEPVELARVCAMAQQVAHRGPDERGTWVSPDGRVAMAFHRLAVIDPAGSHQPMVSECGGNGLVFNGEIYNYKELRSELKQNGERFITSGDTEVVLKAFLMDGVDCLPRLDGMFSLALYEAAEQRLTLARDRMGQKPLWLARVPGALLFASEAKALLADPRVDRRLNPQAAVYYFTMGYIPAPLSAWWGVTQCEPSRYTHVTPSITKTCMYWRLIDQAVKSPPGDYPDALALAKRTVCDAVRRRLVSDVPVGLLLSGGMDSAVVAATASQMASRPMQAFTLAPADNDYDESELAGLSAAACGLELIKVPAGPPEPEDVARIVGQFDQPFADSSAVPTYLVCGAAAERVKVVLSGDGGDEAFGGYDRYRALLIAGGIGPGKYLALRMLGFFAGLFGQRGERSALTRLGRFAESLPYPFPVQYFMHRRLFGPQELSRLFTDTFLDQIDVERPAEWFCDLYEDADVECEMARAQLHDYRTYLPDDLLVKVDIASMANSLEVRSPLLDPEVASLGINLPVDWKSTANRGKRILRDAFSDCIPREVIAGPKRGFAIPVSRWLRTTLKDYVCDLVLSQEGIFRKQAVHGLMNDHLSGRADHGHRIWALLVFALWHQRRCSM